MNICHWEMTSSLSKNGPSDVIQFAPSLLELLTVYEGVFDQLPFPQLTFLITRHLIYFTFSACGKVAEVASPLLIPSRNSSQKMALAGSGPHSLCLHSKKPLSHAKEQQASGTEGQARRLCNLNLCLLTDQMCWRQEIWLQKRYSAERDSNLSSN